MSAPMFYEDSLGAKAAEALENLPSADDELIDDPVALEAAQAEVNAVDPDAGNPVAGTDWIAIYGPERLGGTQTEADQNAAILTMPLDAEGIPYAWDPFPPQGMYVARGVARPFTLRVAPEDARRARELVAPRYGSTPHASFAAQSALSSAVPSSGRAFAWSFFIVFLGATLIALLTYLAYMIYQYVLTGRF